MSIETPRKPVRLAAQGLAEREVSGRKFATRLTGGALAVALVMGAALPAKADRDDVAKALVGALVLGVIVNELDDRPRADPARDRGRGNRVPAVCAISIDGAERSVTLYSENCLRREGVGRLPRECANYATIFGQEDRVYAATCLRDAGFRLSGR